MPHSRINPSSVPKKLTPIKQICPSTNKSQMILTMGASNIQSGLKSVQLSELTLKTLNSQHFVLIFEKTQWRKDKEKKQCASAVCELTLTLCVPPAACD